MAVVFQWRTFTACKDARLRNGRAAALAAWGAAEKAGHLLGDTRLVDEKQPSRVQITLCIEPDGPRYRNVQTVLLGGVRGLFLRVIP